MANFIQKFENQSAYDAAEHQYPNVSLVGTDIVYKMEAEFNGIIATFNVTSTEHPTMVLNSIDNVSKIWINGDEQTEVKGTYQLSTTGEYEVRYALIDPTITGGEGTFDGCYDMVSVIIPNTVTRISSKCFYDLQELASVTIPDSVTSIGEDAFMQCYALTSITIPNSVTSIEDNAFNSCGFTNVTIPNSVTSIGDSAFAYMSNMQSITVEATTPPTLGGDYVFESTNDCPIYVPAASVETYKAASKWSSLASRIQAIPENIVAKYNVTSTSEATTLLNSTTNITYQIIDGVQQDTVQTTYTFDTLGEHTVKYTLLDSTTIGDSAFQNCSNLTSITIPNSVTSIGEAAFYNCGFTSVTIPNSVTSIGQSAFNSCIGLTSITIPNSVTNIGEAAFNGCHGLTSVTVDATTTPTLGGNYVFSGTNANLVIYVPSESVDAYKAAAKWSTYASRIQAIPTI